MADVVTVDTSGGALFKTKKSVASSAGSADAAKLVELGADGALDQTVFPASVWFGDIALGGSPSTPVGGIYASPGTLVVSCPNFLVSGNLIANGTVDFSAVGTVLLQTNSIAWSALPPVNAYSLVCNPSGSPTAASYITAGTPNTVPVYNGATLAFAKVSLGVLADSNACSVVGRSANSTGAVADITASADDRVLGRFSGSLSFAQVPRGALANGSAKSVVGRSANSTGVVADIAGSAARQALMVDSSNANIGFRAFELADLPNAGMSLLARTSNSSGARTNLAPATPAGGGDVLFVENAALVFDNWLRQRRNIQRDFWDFEFGIAEITATSLTNGARIHGTPFTAIVAGVGFMSCSSRGTTYSRNCLTLATYNNGDVAGFLAHGAVTASMGLPTGVGPLILEMGVRCNTLSALNNDYVLNFGFLAAGVVPTAGVYFQYDRATAGSNVWRIVARNGLSTTASNTGTAVAVNTEYRLRIEITASDSATFYINGTNVGTVTSNIPGLLSIGSIMSRTTTSGEPVAFWDVDYVGYQLAFATPRSATTR